jgi:hypothetical protein
MAVVASAYFWKLALAVGLGAMVIASASARPPRRPLPRAELRWPLLGALALYAVGLLALVERHADLAAWLFAAGVAASALTGWLSRSRPGDDPPDHGDPADRHPPPDPDGFDWEAFERELQAWSARSRDRLPVA